jgi:hypothetical protein
MASSPWVTLLALNGHNLYAHAGCDADHARFGLAARGGRTIICVLLIAALAAIWNVLGS